jgi:hypothetical protein
LVRKEHVVFAVGHAEIFVWAMANGCELNGWERSCALRRVESGLGSEMLNLFNAYNAPAVPAWGM